MNYRFIKQIGYGTYSDVYLVEHRATGKPYAVKKVKIHKSVKQEVDILKSLQGVHGIIGFTEYFHSDKFHYIVTEYRKNYVDMIDYLRSKGNARIDKYKFLDIAYNLTSTLVEIHRRNVAHRDIKPENILLDPVNNQIKYIDFGFACNSHNDYRRDVGTLYYIAPESVDPKREYTFKEVQRADIWCLGMTLYTLLIGETYLDSYIRKNIPIFHETSDELLLILGKMHEKWGDNGSIFLEEMLSRVGIGKDIKNLLELHLKLEPNDRNINLILLTIQSMRKSLKRSKSYP